MHSRICLAFGDYQSRRTHALFAFDKSEALPHSSDPTLQAASCPGSVT